MAFTLSRIDRKSRTYELSATVLAEAAAIPPDLTGVDVALLPPRGAPTAATVWFSAVYEDGSFTVLLAGPDADSTGALVVPASADIWMRIADAPEVDAEKLERLIVLGGGTPLLPATGVPVVSVNGKTGTAVVLSASDVGAATPSDLTTGLATKVNTSTYTSGLAAKQDVATLGADVAADATVRAAFRRAIKAPVPTGVVATDTAAITTALASAATAGLDLVFDNPGRYAFNAGFTWDPTKHGVYGASGVILDFTAMTSGTALSIVSSTTTGQAFKQSTHAFQGFTIEGPSADATTVDCITTQGGAFSNPVVNLRDLDVTGFRDQLIIGNLTWCISADRLMLGEFKRRGISYTATTNAGENLYFSGCVIYNGSNLAGTAVGLYCDPQGADATFNFHGCSFDYNNLEMDLRGGHVTLLGSYVEDNNTGPMIRTRDTATTVLNLVGSRVFIPAAAPARTCLVEHVSGSGTRINFASTQLTVYIPAGRDYQLVKVLAGSPVVTTHQSYLAKSGDDGTKQVTGGPALNVLYNPGFDLGTAAGWSTEGGITTDTIQTGTIDTADATRYTSTHALQVVGIGTAGQKVYKQEFDIRPGESVVQRLRVKLTGRTAGQIVLYLRGFAADGTTITASSNSTITADTDWRTFGQFWTPPVGTARIQFRIVFDSLNGTAHLDNCEMNIV